MKKLFQILCIFLYINAWSQPVYSMSQLQKAFDKFIKNILEDDSSSLNVSSNQSSHQEKLLTPSTSNSSLFALLSQTSSDDNASNYSNFLESRRTNSEQNFNQKINPDIENRMRSSDPADSIHHTNKQCSRISICLTVTAFVAAGSIAAFTMYIVNK